MIQITPDDYLGGNGTNETPSIEEVQGHQLSQRAANYAQRQENTVTPDVSDMELLALQSRLAHTQNPLEQIQLEQQINTLASQLVGQPLPQNKPEAPSFNAKEEVFNSYGKETYEDTVGWAGETMSDEVIDSFNSALQSNTEDSIVAFEGLQQLKSLPSSSFVDVDDDVQHMDADLAHQLTSTYGEAGDQLVTLNAALANGHATPAEVMQMAMSDPALRNAAISAAKAGLIQLAI